MILACHAIEKAFGEEIIVKNGSFHIEEHEKTALVGPNGAGKTTLLKMIVGELAPDNGTVTLSKDKTLGYLAQHQEMNSTHTIYEEVRTAKAEIFEINGASGRSNVRCHTSRGNGFRNRWKPITA